MNTHLKEIAAGAFQAFKATEEMVQNRVYIDALTRRALTDKQKDNIAEKFSYEANGVRFDKTRLNADKSFEENAAHGFVDSIRKSAGLLQNVQYGAFKDEQELFEATSEYAELLRNTIENAKTLELDSDFLVKIQIQHLEKVVLKAFDNILDELETQGYSRDSLNLNGTPEAVESIRRLENEDLSI
ncbi:MAG: hypothetical protein ACRBCK_08215 [Alphaproteobacteria bacterium]